MSSSSSNTDVSASEATDVQHIFPLLSVELCCVITDLISLSFHYLQHEAQRDHSPEVEAKKLKNSDEELLTQNTCKLSLQDKENISSNYSEASTIFDTNGNEDTGKAAAVADVKPPARTHARVPLGELPVSGFGGLEEDQLVSWSTFFSSSSTDEIDNQSDKDWNLTTKNASLFIYINHG
ncbi:hypothetical protein N7510_001717 [Penicillium lagena]|uniref:uncharacterized protein n=1 Tax=Penicillium lagena TaxID=94218 RepID=UPI00253FE8F4|nr:uncharacterized protein N7510_001717 [Penicillium lagena]KAJ5625408.1 hypothetical protein N7510_001717 [Penicillium lagena]